jgi:hypoxanthine phosphoribosyltransferase
MKRKEIFIEGKRVEPLYSEREIGKKIAKLARQIYKEYKEKIEKGEKLVIVLILNGAMFFGTELYRILEGYFLGSLELDTLAVSSYRSGTKAGRVKILKDLNRPASGKHLLIVEDIVDTGETLAEVLKFLKAKNPKSIRVAVLIDKIPRRKVKVKIDFVGFRVKKPYWLVGYGLDYKEMGRSLPFVGALKRV